ncbi:unnamed protein product [Meloidogyne enterolobii]|uniref:Uncharacterized protein n=1 Tax=Meloidogyne enterolobii TaxID=390850 RepID=A0ACB0XVR1_MELEN
MKTAEEDLNRSETRKRSVTWKLDENGKDKVEEKKEEIKEEKVIEKEVPKKEEEIKKEGFISKVGRLFSFGKSNEKKDSEKQQKNEVAVNLPKLYFDPKHECKCYLYVEGGEEKKPIPAKLAIEDFLENDNYDPISAEKSWEICQEVKEISLDELENLGNGIEESTKEKRREMIQKKRVNLKRLDFMCSIVVEKRMKKVGKWLEWNAIILREYQLLSTQQKSLNNNKIEDRKEENQKIEDLEKCQKFIESIRSREKYDWKSDIQQPIKNWRKTFDKNGLCDSVATEMFLNEGNEVCDQTSIWLKNNEFEKGEEYMENLERKCSALKLYTHNMHWNEEKDYYEMDNGSIADKQLEWLLKALKKINMLTVVSNEMKNGQKCDEILIEAKKIETDKINDELPLLIKKKKEITACLEQIKNKFKNEAKNICESAKILRNIEKQVFDSEHIEEPQFAKRKEIMEKMLEECQVVEEKEVKDGKKKMDLEMPENAEDREETIMRILEFSGIIWERAINQIGMEFKPPIHCQHFGDEILQEIINGNEMEGVERDLFEKMEPQCILNYSIDLGKRAKKLADEWDIEIPEDLLMELEEREDYFGEDKENENSSKNKTNEELKNDNEIEEEFYDYSRAIVPYRGPMNLPKIEEEEEKKEEDEKENEDVNKEIKEEEKVKEVEEVKKEEKDENEEKEEENEIPKRYRTRTRFTIKNKNREVTVKYSHEFETEISEEEKEPKSKEIKIENEKEETGNNSMMDTKSEEIEKKDIIPKDLKGEDIREETVNVHELNLKKEEETPEKLSQESKNPKEEEIEVHQTNPLNEKMLKIIKSKEKVQSKENSVKNENIEKEMPIIENKPEENQNKKEQNKEPKQEPKNQNKTESITEDLENKKSETPRKITAKTNGGAPLNHKENKEIPQTETKQISEKPKEIVQSPLNNAQNEIKNPLNHHKNKEISEKFQVKENIPNKLENNEEIKQITPILPPPKENGNNQQNKLGKKPKSKKQKRKNARKGKGKKRNKKKKNKNKKNNNGKQGGNKPARKRRNKNRRKNKNKPNQINNTLHEIGKVQGLNKGQENPNAGKKQAENQPKPAEQSVSKAIVPHVAKNIPKLHNIPNAPNTASTPPNPPHNRNNRHSPSPLGQKGKNGLPPHPQPPSGNKNQPNNHQGQKLPKKQFKGISHPGPSIFSIKHEFRPDGSVRIHTKILGANPFATGNTKHRFGLKLNRVKRGAEQFGINNYGKEKQNNQPKCLNVNVCEIYKFLDLSAIKWWWCRDIEKDDALEIVKNINLLIEDIGCVEDNNKCKKEEEEGDYQIKAEQHVEQFFEKVLVASGIDEMSQNGDYMDSECLIKLSNTLTEKKKEICGRFMEEKDDNDQNEFNEGLDEEEKEEFTKLCSEMEK